MAAKRINKCPGSAGKTQPIKPTINKLPVTNHTALPCKNSITQQNYPKP